MPLRSPKMYSFIFGFQRRVWWPKCTPASSNSFMVISTAKFPPLRIAVCAHERNALAKEQPFCRLLAGRDLGGFTCANPPELEAEYLKTRCPANLEYPRSRTAESRIA